MKNSAELLAKDYEERSKPDITLWMVDELKVKRGTKFIPDSVIEDHISKVKDLLLLGKVVGCAWDGLDSRRIDGITMERLVRAFFEDLKAKRIIWLKGLMGLSLRRLVIKVYNKIVKE